jgi:hypothetical protein
MEPLKSIENYISKLLDQPDGRSWGYEDCARNLRKLKSNSVFSAGKPEHTKIVIEKLFGDEGVRASYLMAHNMNTQTYLELVNPLKVELHLGRQTSLNIVPPKGLEGNHLNHNQDPRIHIHKLRKEVNPDKLTPFFTTEKGYWFQDNQGKAIATFNDEKFGEGLARLFIRSTDLE